MDTSPASTHNCTHPVWNTLVLLGLLVLCPQALARDAVAARSVETLWMLNCQGCHRADGSGTGNAVPALSGIVARFLSVPGGREYLIRVPGVAASPLQDAPLSELVNWMLERFDPQHSPSNFKPYTAAEVASYRKLGAYGAEAGTIRANLTRSFAPDTPTGH